MKVEFTEAAKRAIEHNKIYGGTLEKINIKMDTNDMTEALKELQKAFIAGDNSLPPIEGEKLRVESLESSFKYTTHTKEMFLIWLMGSVLRGYGSRKKKKADKLRLKENFIKYKFHLSEFDKYGLKLSQRERRIAKEYDNILIPDDHFLGIKPKWGKYEDKA